MPSPAEFDEVERAFAACDTPVQIELAHLGDPAIGVLLTKRGYRLTSLKTQTPSVGTHLRPVPARGDDPDRCSRRSGSECRQVRRLRGRVAALVVVMIAATLVVIVFKLRSEALSD